ncbi:unnamed protein product [Trifolium pratense]|uniref:Uncharacterized protein n=1 Tax=Trifolium pratense TaxID=57577 RepID=A0ACB0LC32_TRIPR|nr:unnamed protein product [Trifolium pratense]
MKLSSLDDKNSVSTESRNLLAGSDLVNFDTTALIAFVSGISNGGTEKLLATPESDLRQRFKGNFDFVIGQNGLPFFVEWMPAYLLAEPAIALGMIWAGALQNATAAEPGAAQSYSAAVNW